MLRKLRAAREKSHQHNVKKSLGEDLRKAALRDDLDQLLKIIAGCNNDPEVINYAPHVSIHQRSMQLSLLFPGESNQRHSTALEIAARNGHLGIVSALLKVPGIDLNPRSHTENMSTPLLSAISFGHEKIVEALCEAHGIKPELRSASGENALTLAFLFCPQAVPSLLKIPGINVNETNRNGSAPLHYAVKHSKSSANLKLLLDMKDIQIDIRDNDGYTPLMLAVKKGSEKFTKLLLDAGASTSLRNSGGLTAREIAALYRHKEMIELLDQYSQLSENISSTIRKQP